MLNARPFALEECSTRSAKTNAIASMTVLATKIAVVARVLVVGKGLDVTYRANKAFMDSDARKSVRKDYQMVNRRRFNDSRSFRR